MTLTITDRQMTSDATEVYASRVGLEAGPEEWAVTGYPGRRLSRNQAITAMTLAERLAAGYGEDDPHVRNWRAELGLS
jgi:hypothetical protein